MTYNLLQEAISIKNDISCMYDLTYGFNSIFPTNGNVEGWDVYSKIYLYGSWNKVLFGTSKENTCYIGRTDNFAPVIADDYYNFKIMMKLTAPINHYKAFPTQGKLQWLTNTDSTWDDYKSVLFDLIQTDSWTEYSINLAELQFWNGSISNLRFAPFVDGYTDIQFAIKYIRIESDNVFKCLNTQCSYYTKYSHPCQGIGTFGSVTSGVSKTHYTTVSGVSDSLLVNIDNYGDEQINLGTHTNITGQEMSKIIMSKLSLVGIGGYAYNYSEHTEDNRLNISSGNLGFAEEDALVLPVGKQAIYIKAYSLVTDYAYFEDFNLVLSNPFPYIYIITGDLLSIAQWLYNNDKELLSVKDTLIARDLFQDIQDVKTSENFDILQVRLYDPHAGGYVPSNIYSTIQEDLIVIASMKGVLSGGKYPPNYLKDFTNDRMLIDNPDDDTYLTSPMVFEINTRQLELVARYSDLKVFILKLGNSSTLSVEFGIEEFKYSLFESTEKITNDYIKAMYPYSGLHEPSTVLITGGTAKEVLGFDNNTTQTYAVKPATGFEFASARRLHAYEIDRLVNQDTTKFAYSHNPDQYVVEAGRRDYFESITANSVSTSNSPDFYKTLDGTNSILIDATHPVNDCGRLNNIKVSGSKHSGATPSILLFRPSKDGALIKVHETYFGEDDPNALYTSKDSTYYIMFNWLVSKGDLIGFRNFDLLCPYSSKTLLPNAVMYKISNSVSIESAFYPKGLFTQGVIGASFYAYSNRLQDSMKLLIDIGKRTNLGSVDICGQEFGDVFEYNIAACLDTQWQCNTYGSTHMHSAVNDYNGAASVWEHLTVPHGLDCLSDGVRTIDGGQQGTAFTTTTNGLATSGKHSYFYLNGDTEWPYSREGKGEFSRPWYAIRTYDYEYDPFSIYMIIPGGKSVPINKSVIYFKEANNFKHMSLSYYMGPNGPEGNAEDIGYQYIKEFNKVSLDGVGYYPDSGDEDTITTYDYIFPNPMPITKLTYVNKVATNWSLYQVAGNTEWNIIEHVFDPVEAYGYKIYCDWHKSTKIVEIELYSSFTVVPTLVDNFTMKSSIYGDYWDDITFNQDVDDPFLIHASVISAPRYLKLEVSPQSEFELYEITFNLEQNSLKTLSCDSTLLITDAPKGRVTKAQSIEVENTYSVPLNLFVDIPSQLVSTSDLLLWNKLSSVTTASLAETGPGALIVKNEDYPLILHKSQVAINCPSYYLNNLIDNKQAYVFEKDTYWRDFGTLAHNQSIDYFNEPTLFNSSIFFDGVSSKYWKLVLGGIEVHRVHSVSLYYEDEVVPNASIYIQAQNSDAGVLKIPAPLNSLGVLENISVLNDSFNNNAFMDYWQHEIPTGNGLIEFDDSLAFTTLVSGTSSSVERILDYPVNSFEFKLGFEFNPGDLVRQNPLDVYTAQSVIFDMESNHGATKYLGVLAVRFYLNNVLIEFTDLSEFTTYASLGHSSYLSAYPFLTNVENLGYLSSGAITNQRLIFSPNTAITFDKVEIYNHFNLETYGAKYVKIKISTDVITDITYDAPISNSTTIFDDTFLINDSGARDFSEDLVLTPYMKFMKYSATCFDSNNDPLLVFDVEVVRDNVNMVLYTPRLDKVYTGLADASYFSIDNTPDYINSLIGGFELSFKKENTRLSSIILRTQDDSLVLFESTIDYGYFISRFNKVRITYSNEDLYTSYSPANFIMKTNYIDIVSIPILSNNEAIIFELPGSEPIDRIKLVIDNNELFHTAIYISNSGYDDFTLWASNFSRSLVSLATHQSVHASCSYYARHSWQYYYGYPWLATSMGGGWQAIGTLPQWWMYDFGADNGKIVNKVQIKFGLVYWYGTPRPHKAQFFGSNDSNLDWETKEKTFLTECEIEVISGDPGDFLVLNNTNSYQYYCVYFPDTTSSDISYYNDNFADSSIINNKLWYKWIPSSSEAIEIYNEKLRFTSACNSNGSSYLEGIYKLRGDFNIQIDFERVSAPSGFSVWSAGIDFVMAGYTAYIRVAGYTDEIRYVSGGLSEQQVVTTDVSGKLRMARVGNTLNTYYYTEATWALLSTVSNDVYLSDGKVRLLTSISVSTGTSVEPVINDFDNFIINSGQAVTTTYNTGILYAGLFEEVTGGSILMTPYCNQIYFGGSPDVTIFQSFLLDGILGTSHSGFWNYVCIDLHKIVSVFGINVGITYTTGLGQVRGLNVEASLNSTNGVDGDWVLISDLSTFTAPINYPGRATFYFDTPFNAYWLRLSEGGPPSYPSYDPYITDFEILTGAVSSTIYLEQDLFDSYFAIDLGDIYTLDFLRSYGDNTNRVYLPDQDIKFSETEVTDPLSVVWTDDNIDVRWIRIPLLNGDNVNRMIQYLGIYPDTSHAYKKNGGFNCDWKSLGNLLSRYNYSYNLAPSGSMVYTSFNTLLTKTIILDALDNHGYPYCVGLRSMEFYDETDTLVPLTSSDFVVYATSELGGLTYYSASYIFITSLPKTGYWRYGWLSTTLTNNRIICVLNEAIQLSRIVINNGHRDGGYETSGIKSARLTVSEDVISDLYYTTTPENSSVVFDSIFEKHKVGDTADDEVVVSTLLSSMDSYYFDWAPENCISGNNQLEGFENCWAFKPDDLERTVVIDLGKDEYVNRFFIVHSYSDTDTATWVNTKYTISGKSDSEAWFSPLVYVVDNSSDRREHIIDLPVLIRFIKLEIHSFTKPDQPVRIYDEATKSYSYIDGGFVREFEIWLSDEAALINSEVHPIVCTDLKSTYELSGHELITNKEILEEDLLWDNSEEFFKYSDNISDDPNKVSFINSTGAITMFTYSASLLNPTNYIDSMTLIDQLYLVSGYYTIDWESYGAVSDKALFIELSGPDTLSTFSDNIATGWVDQYSTFSVSIEGTYFLTINKTIDDVYRWGLRNLTIQKNSSKSKWVLVKRDTAVDHSWDNDTVKYGIDYLSTLKVFSSDKFLPTEVPWWWSSTISTVSSDPINTKVGRKSLRVDYPTSSGVDRLDFIEGDHFGWDENWSIKDTLSFWLFISDLGNLCTDEGGFGFGSFYGSESDSFVNSSGESCSWTPSTAIYTWDFKYMDLKTGWNQINLQFDENTYTNPLLSSTTKLADKVLNFRESFFTSFGIVYRGIGAPFYMLLDGLEIKRNWFNDTVVHGNKGLCLTWKEYAEIPLGGLTLRQGSIEFWLKFYTSTAGKDSFGDVKSRTLFNITNNNNEIISLTIRSAGWLEVGFGGARYNFKTMYADPLEYDLSSVIFNEGGVAHVALVWSNDGKSMTNTDTLRLYINNALVISTKDTWTVSDSKSASLRLGGASTILANNNDAEGSAIFSNIKVYDYCKDSFEINQLSPSELDTLNHNSLLQVSSDGLNFYDINSGKLPLKYKEVPPGEKVTIYTRVDKTNIDLIDKKTGTIDIEWEVIV